MFHAENGWFFERLANGSVVVALVKEGGDPARPQDHEAAHTFSADTWASIVAQVSRGGEVDHRWFAVRSVHESRGPLHVAPCPLGGCVEDAREVST